MNTCDLYPTDKYCNTFYVTKAAIIIATTTGSISLISSVVILIVINRSEIRFSSIYHRIIAAQSLMDIIVSLAILLTTLPMPRDQIYPFEGPTLGTVTTCQIQGFAYILGIIGTFLYHNGLAYFYVFIIQFRVNDEKMRTFVEPTIHIFTCLSSIITATVFLCLDLYNPMPFESWCSITPYPYDCFLFEDIECIHGYTGNSNIMKTIIWAIVGFSVFGFINLLGCMGVIVYGNCFHQGGDTDGEDESSSAEGRESWRSAKKILQRQALMYTTVYLLIWGLPLIVYLNRTFIYGFFDALKVIFVPLSGFFNASIFLYHKVYNVVRSEPSCTYREALYLVLIHPEMIPEIMITGVTELPSQEETELELVEIQNMTETSSVKGASKDVQLSMFSSSEEVSFMFDYKSKQTSNNDSSQSIRRSSNEDALQEREGDDKFDDNSRSLSRLDNDLSLSRPDSVEDIFDDSAISRTTDSQASTMRWGLGRFMNI